MKKMYSLLLAAVLVTALFVTTGCPGRGAGAVRTRTDTLVIVSHVMPPNLDPTLTNEIGSARMHRHIYSTLVDLDTNMNIVPSLAYRWQFEYDAHGNATQLRMFLRRGVLFHNGDELKASDVYFSLMRAAASPHVGHITGMVENVEVINDYEVLLTMPFPFSPILNHLAHTAMSILNERAVTALGVDGHSLAPVGTGPFRVTNIVTGDRIEFARWDQYFGTPARIPNMVLRIVPDAATRLIELELGAIDLIVDIAPFDIARVEANPDLILLRGPSLLTEYIGFNVQRPPFNDVRVRQAINYAIDTETIVAIAYAGAGSVSTGPLSPMVWGSISDQLEPFQFNPDRARQLLAEAGFPNGFNAVIGTNDNPARLDAAEMTRHMLAQVGINVDLEIREMVSILDMTHRGELDMFSIGWFTLTGDADYGLHPLFHSSNFGAAGNRSFYYNPTVDRLLDEARRETNPARRLELYAEVQHILRDEAVINFSWVGEILVGIRSDVRGFNLHPSQVHLLTTVYFAP